MLIPALLCTTENELFEKLNLIELKIAQYYEITNQKELRLHIDWIGNIFAFEHKLKPTVSLDKIIKLLKQFIKIPSVIQFHIMGAWRNDEELNAVNEILQTNWGSIFRIEIYVSDCLESSSRIDQKIVDKKYEQITINNWYALNTLPVVKQLENNLALCMDIETGKSGQVPDIQWRKELVDFAKANKKIIFSFDGGFAWNYKNTLPNVDIISNSSFWKHFEKL